MFLGERVYPSKSEGAYHVCKGLLHAQMLVAAWFLVVNMFTLWAIIRHHPIGLGRLSLFLFGLSETSRTSKNLQKSKCQRSMCLERPNKYDDCPYGQIPKLSVRSWAVKSTPATYVHSVFSPGWVPQEKLTHPVCGRSGKSNTSRKRSNNATKRIKERLNRVF